MVTRIVIGAAVGLLAGGVLGYVGRCRSGACPLIGDPFVGSVVGAVLGAMLAYTLLGSQLHPQSALAATASTEQDFEKEVLQADKPVLVDFFATWCGPCKIQAPVLEAIEKDYAGKVAVVTIDIDKARKLAGTYGVQAVPTVMLYHRGKQVEKWVGVQKAEVFRQALVYRQF